MEEVHEDVPEGLHVVPPGLLDAEVSIDGGVTGGAGKVLVLPVWNVLVRAVIAELLGQTKVDCINL